MLQLPTQRSSQKVSVQQTFSIELVSSEKPVILAIAQFLKELIPSDLNHLLEKDNLIGIFERTQSLAGSAKSYGSVRLHFSKFVFISLFFLNRIHRRWMPLLFSFCHGP